MTFEVDFKIVKINKGKGSLNVRYFVVGNESISLDYQYQIPVTDGVPATPEEMMAILALRKPIDDLKRLSKAVDIDLSAFEVLVEPDPEPEPEPVEEKTFAEQQSSLLKRVDERAKLIRNSIMSDYSAFEAASWPIKLDEAKRVSQMTEGLSAEEIEVIDFAEIAPMLLEESAHREISISELTQKVLQKSAQFSMVEALISGYAGKLIDQIKSVPEGDVSALLSIDIQSEWPVL